MVPITSETVRPRIISLWRTNPASPLAPKKMKTATRASSEVAGEKAEDEEPDGEDLADGRGDVRAPHGAEAGGEQAAQDPPAVHREGGYQVEDGERHVHDSPR